MSFDFEGAEEWEVSTDTYLPSGNYVVEITSADGSEKSSGGHNQIELEVGCAQGTRKDWVTYNDKSVSKVATLFKVAGVELKNSDQDDGKLHSKKVAELVGKKVGVVIRDEQKYNAPMGEMVPRIKGYVPVETIKDQPAPVAAGAAGKSDDDIPF